ncbi:DUF982 domain-containing protein [Rhizobium cauense]|nr:DUF982 domain-containing protein [Rhizobium cauense]MBW9116916.1 DUF982 domain-containing protein [Rhizobium cauense]
MSTFDRYWPIPIVVRLQNGSERTFRSIHDTLDFLEHEWPKASGAYHEAAVIGCRSVLGRSGSAATSKELFVSACLEAGLAIRTAANSRPHLLA